MATTRQLDGLLGGFEGISLEQLDARAGLLRRVDNKYVVAWDGFLELLDRLASGHQLLVIDGRREFHYRTVYFDTPDCRCFRDHVEDRAPRFKARTRLYEDTGNCVFEVKLKREDGEMDKRQVDHPAGRTEELTEAGRECLGSVLSGAGLEAPDRLDPTLVTEFDRVTFAGRGRPERVTCDLGITLSSPNGDSARIKDGLVVVETKTEDGHGSADQALRGVGAEPVSLSKYRVGMSLVGNAEVPEPQPGDQLFEVAER